MLSTLIRELQVLELRGFGERRVIDDRGYEVVEVKGPLSAIGDYQPDGDATAVLLDCCAPTSGSSSGATT